MRSAALGLLRSALLATLVFAGIRALPAQTAPSVTVTTTPSGTTPPAQQPKVSIAIASAYPVALNGTLTLSFANASGVDNPETRFATGDPRTAAFTIAAGSKQASFNGAATATIIGGTVGGNITLTVTQLTDASGNDVTPSPAPSVTLTVNTTPPVITSVKITTSGGNFTVAVTGYSSARDMSTALFHFVPTTGTTLNATDFTVQVGTAFTAWYSNPASQQYGSQFTLTVPFTVQGSSFPIAVATVTLTNSKGTSNPSAPASP